MNLKVTELARIATDVAHEVSSDLRVVGVTLGAGGGEYAEVLLTIEGCRKEPCQIALGFLRNVPRSVVHTHIAEKLREHMKAHQD